jgi:hypothetical protein
LQNELPPSEQQTPPKEKILPFGVWLFLSPFLVCALLFWLLFLLYLSGPIYKMIQNYFHGPRVEFPARNPDFSLNDVTIESWEAIEDGISFNLTKAGTDKLLLLTAHNKIIDVYIEYTQIGPPLSVHTPIHGPTIKLLLNPIERDKMRKLLPTKKEIKHP